MAPDKTATKRKSASSSASTAKKPRKDLAKASKRHRGDEEEFHQEAKAHLLNGLQANTSNTPKLQSKAEDAVPSADHIPLSVRSEDEEQIDDIDDQTAALLKGFESSSSSEDEAEGVPDASSKSKSKSVTKSDAAKSKATSQDSAVVYVGRIPHGFYEHQMRGYFSQFGDITRLRLSRNRRTGASKHFAFIEFASPQVARIVVGTMDNYLVFGHLLKVKVVPKARLEEEGKELFKGSGGRFRKVPWNRIEMSRVKSTDREGWEKRVTRERKRREEKAKKLRELGYEFEMPTLKAVEDVPRKVIDNGAAEAVTAGAEDGGVLVTATESEEAQRQQEKVDIDDKTDKSGSAKIKSQKSKTSGRQKGKKKESNL